MKLNPTILKPHITEKSMIATGRSEYTFLVDPGATKNGIVKAVTDLFKVNVLDVKTILLKGKHRRVGKKRLTVLTSPKKKAIVKLKEGQKIDLFETGGQSGNS